MKALWRRWRADPQFTTWLPAGLYGGSSGGLAVAWLTWGGAGLLNSSLCFVITAPVALLMFLFVCTMGISLVILVGRFIKAVRQITRPLSIAMYEPVEPLIELEVIAWPHPGCGLAIYIPLIFISAAVSLPWFWFGVRTTPVVPLLLLLVVGMLLGLWLAKREVKRW